MQKFRILESWYQNFRSRIEEDLPDIGWMLYVYENDFCIYDSDQDTLKMCQEEAFKEFGIPLDSWVEVTEE
jgi:hypothetical protein